VSRLRSAPRSRDRSRRRNTQRRSSSSRELTNNSRLSWRGSLRPRNRHLRHSRLTCCIYFLAVITDIPKSAIQLPDNPSMEYYCNICLLASCIKFMTCTREELFFAFEDIKFVQYWNTVDFMCMLWHICVRLY